MQEHGKFLYMDGSGEICHTEAPARAEDPAEALANTRQDLDRLIDAIADSGMDPLTQLLGFFTTEDPTYLPEGVNARNLAYRVGRDKLLSAVLAAYLNARDGEADQ